MVVLSKTLILATSAFTLFLGTHGAALKPRIDNVVCFNAGNEFLDGAGAQHAINDFCSPNKYGLGETLKYGSTFSYNYNIIGGILALNVNNIHCPDGMWIDMEGCWGALGNILGDCWVGPDGTNVGGSYATDCGHWILQMNPPVTKREFEVEKRCDQTCYDLATSGCFPPNWDTCTAAEKSCLVGSAADAQGCLKAGNCVANC